MVLELLLVIKIVFFCYEQIWEVFFEKMFMIVMIRNFGKMTNVGVLVFLTDGMIKVCDKLRDEESFKSVRVYLFFIFLVLKQY